MENRKKYIVTYRIQGEVSINLTPLVEFVYFLGLLLFALVNLKASDKKARVTDYRRNETFTETVAEEVAGEQEERNRKYKEPEIVYKEAWNYQKNRVETVPHLNMKSCANCGQAFTGKRSDAKFCSDNCKNKYNNPKR
jgi:hypothetical protein